MGWLVLRLAFLSIFAKNTHMIHIIYIYLMINCFIAGILNAINKDGGYAKHTVIGGTLLAVLVGLPIGIGVYIYLKMKDKKEITL